ncbi:ALK and LTK ligand 2b [Clinocottus analis]|uniref:ALK and LTK ligand 2b n=1 Tax=Clinocottus analis TaxID=304258 RepID=UPI0035BFF248
MTQYSSTPGRSTPVLRRLGLMDAVRVALLSALVLLLLSGRCSRARSDRDGEKSLESRSTRPEPRDQRHKEKFIRQLTGSLNFTPKCKKHFYRLYYSTRDCTIPAYFRRCARLLTRLAGSPHCAER